MNKGWSATLAVGGLACLVAVSALANAYADPLLSRFPGARRLESDHLDLSRIGRGQVDRQADFHSELEILDVTRWYMLVLDLGPEAEVHYAANCVSMRAVQPVAMFQRTVAVLLCSAAHGTSIAVNESLVLWP